MKVSIPQTQVTLCVKANEVFHLHTIMTSGKMTLALAKKHFKDKANWCEEWQAVNVVSVDKAGKIDFEIPVSDLVSMLTDYMSAHNEQAIAVNDEKKEG